MRKLLFTFLTLWLFATSFAQVGHLDSSFGTNGFKTLGDPVDLDGYELIKSFPADNGGRFDVMGITYFTDGPLFIVKYLKDGSLDATYGTNGVSDGVIMNPRSVVRQADGRITAAGVIDNEYSSPHHDLVMYHFANDGTVDYSYKIGYEGSQYEDVVSLKVQENTVILSGVSASVHIGTYYFVKIVYPDGSDWSYESPIFYNATFDYEEEDAFYYYEGLEDPFANGYKVAIEGEKIVLEGPMGYTHTEFYQDNKVFHQYTIEYTTVRLNGDGTRDASFGVNGSLPMGSYTFPANTDNYAPKTSPVRKVVLAPVLNGTNGNQDFSVTVYKEDETIDQSFGNGGTVTLDFGGDDVPFAYAWQGNDLLVGGSTTRQTGRSDALSLARFTSTGALDPAFNGTGKQLIPTTGLDFTLKQMQLQKNGSKNTLIAIGETMIAAVVLEDDAQLTCVEDKEVPVFVGATNAVVKNIDPSLTPASKNVIASYTLSGATTGSGSGSASGKTFNKGITTVTYKLAGTTTQTCTFTITLYDPGAPLPVKLVAFDGKLMPTGAVQLTWQTATEVNSFHYVVERSDEKGQFIEIGKVAATGAGSAYLFSDNKPLQGINTYRLRLVDRDGKQAYSTTVSVNIASRNAITLSPNPSVGMVKVTLQGRDNKNLVQVFSASGSPVYSRQHTGNNFTLDLSHLPSGVYLLRMGNEQTRLIIAK